MAERISVFVAQVSICFQPAASPLSYRLIPGNSNRVENVSTSAGWKPTFYWWLGRPLLLGARRPLNQSLGFAQENMRDQPVSPILVQDGVFFELEQFRVDDVVAFGQRSAGLIRAFQLVLRHGQDQVRGCVRSRSPEHGGLANAF